MSNTSHNPPYPILKIVNDTQGITHALRCAGLGIFNTTPNPRVGAVIVKNGCSIGEGYTQPAGQAHAEIQALHAAMQHGFDVRGSTLYVTLEPCNHHGRTPPCTNALIQAGIAKVVVAVQDPNPLVAGKGLARLRAAGIEVICGVLASEARELNIGFFSRMERSLPWVRMKVAASLDGKTALHNRESQWITSQASRDDGHAWRARACAILTGIGTVMQDDPQLTVRAVATSRQPRRIIIDSKLEIDLGAKVLKGAGSWVVTARENPEKEAMLRDMGIEIIHLPNANGKVDLPALMLELGNREINELHVEAGAKLNGSLIQEKCVDELLIYFAPHLLGDAMNMFDLKPIDRLQDKLNLEFHDITKIGKDVRILARFC